MIRIFEETMIIESLREDKIRLHGLEGPMKVLEVSADEFTYRLGRYYCSNFKLGQEWVASTLKIRKNVPSCLCNKTSVIFFLIRCPKTKLPIWFRYHPTMKYKTCQAHGSYILINNKRVFKADFSRFQYNCQIKRIEKFKMKTAACSTCLVIKCVRC